MLRKAVAAVVGLVAVAGTSLLAWHRAQPPQHCALAMTTYGSRCCGAGQDLRQGRCSGEPSACAESMKPTPVGCLPTRRKVAIAAGELKLAPSDWEATRRVAPYQAHVPAFLIDSHEATEQDWSACVRAGVCAQVPQAGEPGRAQVNVTAVEASRYCNWRGGALPTRDQLVFAALGAEQRRYPWGNTGAVCRRAAFGLDHGPCASGADGPQLAGSHPTGATPEGVQDLAGNAAEWSAPVDGVAEVRGGSWRDEQASALRTWSFERMRQEQRADHVGFRCTYAGSTPADG